MYENDDDLVYPTKDTSSASILSELEEREEIDKVCMYENDDDEHCGVNLSTSQNQIIQKRQSVTFTIAVM